MAVTFLHPHTAITVIDNSDVFETATGGGTTLFMPFLSDKGEDMVVKTHTDLNVLLQRNGFPNYKKHGQAYYNAIQWLRGGGRVYGIRLTAENATYANTVLNVKAKAAQVPVYQRDARGNYAKDAAGNRIPEMEVDGVTPKTQPGVQIKLVSESVANLADKNAFASLLDENEVDAEGYTSFRLYGGRLKGRGQFGGNYSMRMVLNTSYEDTYTHRLYDFSILERTSNGNLRVVEGPIQVSLFPEAQSIGQTSMFISQMAKDYFNETEIVFNEDAYDKLMDLIVESALDANGLPVYDDPSVIDLLFGTDKTGELDERIVLSSDSVALDYVEGISFENGSDGDFDTKTDRATRNAAIAQAYISAYSGLVDPTILNKKQYPVQVALDANFPLEVKRAIADFCAERQDVMGIGDTGILANANAALSWRKNSFQVDSFYFSIFGQSFNIYDSFTLQDIPVTATYVLAQKIPANDSAYGIQFPFVGPNRGLITGVKSLDWNPNEYEKEDLYKARVNYIEQDYRNIKFMSQLTSQYKNSALSNINNVRVLMEIIRAVDELAEQYQYEFADAATLNSYNSNLSNILSQWVNSGACSVANGTAYQQGYDHEQKIARVKLEIVFVNVIERILMEVNIGK